MTTETEMQVDPEVEFPKVEQMLYGLAWSFTRKYGWDFEDSRSEAYSGFMKACRNYRQGKGTKFSSWCHMVVWGFLQSEAIRRYRNPATFVEINEEICGEVPEVANPKILELAEKTTRGSLQDVFSTLASETPRQLFEVSQNLSDDAQDLLNLFWSLPKELRVRGRRQQIETIREHHARLCGEERSKAAFYELRGSLSEAFA